MLRRSLAVILAWILICMQTVCMHAQPLETDLPFDIDAVSVLLMDANTGTVIYEKNADEQRPVASITKLMTMLLVLEAIEEGKISLQQEVTVSKQAAGMGGSQALLDAGGIYTAEDLLKSLIIASANDSAVALAELLGGSESAFAQMMNARAAQLGLHATHYVNASGLPAEGQYTSARDVAALSLEVMKHPLYFTYSTVWMDEIRHKGDRVTELVNTNRLIRFYDGADGVKTGSTNEAGFCISATAQRGEDRFLAVVLGSSTGKARFALAQKLLDHAFDHYSVKILMEEGEIISETIDVKGSRTRSIQPAAGERLQILTKKAVESEAEVKLTLPQTLHAPMEKGDVIGQAQVISGGEVIASIPVVLRENVDKSGIFGILTEIMEGWMKGKVVR